MYNTEIYQFMVDKHSYVKNKKMSILSEPQQSMWAGVAITDPLHILLRKTAKVVMKFLNVKYGNVLLDFILSQ